MFKYLVLSHLITFHWPKPWLNPKSKEKERYSFLVIKTTESQSKDLDIRKEELSGPIE